MEIALRVRGPIRSVYALRPEVLVAVLASQAAGVAKLVPLLELRLAQNKEIVLLAFGHYSSAAPTFAAPPALCRGSVRLATTACRTDLYRSPALARGIFTFVATQAGPSFFRVPGGGFAAAGNAEKRGFAGGSRVAWNVNIPRASRRHYKLQVVYAHRLTS